MDSIILSEKIHPVIQGEGVNTNQKMIVVRVFGCPLRCEECDSKQTWSRENSIEYDLKSFYKEIKKNLKKFNTNHILLTGGEPGLYVDFITKFFEVYQEKSEWKWDIETSGITDWSNLYEWEYYIQFNFSPKIGSLIPEKEAELKGLKSLPSNYIIKVVVDKDSFDQNIQSIKSITQKYNIENDRVYLMPQGTEKSAVVRNTKWLTKKVFKLPYNFTTRQHILIYGSKKLV